MANDTEKDNSPASNETPTTHAKKAQFTALGLVVLVGAGLVINTVSNFKSSDERKAERAAAQAEKEQKGQERPERKMADFAAEQQQAQREISADSEEKKDEERRNAILDKIAKDGAADGNGNSNGGPVKPQTLEDIDAEFKLEERKRALSAMREGMGRTESRLVAGAPQPAASPLGRVDEQINALTANQQDVAQRQRALVERAKAMGVDLPAALAGRASMMPTGGTPAGEAAVPVNTKGGAAGPATFGELGINRVTRDPASSGPKPGEKILPTGSIVSAVLDMDMMSDYAGNWIALVQRPVYDVELENVLIPAGSKIVGKSVRATGPNEFIQNRMGATPLWIVRPDGKRLDFRKTSSTDSAGVAALRGTVDNHFLAQFFGIGAYAIIGLGPSLSNYGSAPETSRDAFIREATGKSRDVGRAFAEKYLNVVPTQRVFAGTPMKIFIEDDIFITPWNEIDATHFNNR